MDTLECFLLRNSIDYNTLAPYKCSQWPYIFHKNEKLDFSMPATLVMLTYYVWYHFTYFKQLEPMFGEKQLL